MARDLAQEAADAITALSGATPQEARRTLGEYPVRDQAAALAVSGGGGDGLPTTGGTLSGPLDIDSGQDEVVLNITSASNNENTVQIHGAAGFVPVDIGVWDGSSSIGVGGGTDGSIQIAATSAFAYIQVRDDQQNESVKIQGRAGEDLMEVGSGGQVVGGIHAGGYFYIAVNTAPADGILAAGQAALWFDSSNGAAKLMIKAKQADGTIKTGSINVQT